MTPDERIVFAYRAVLSRNEMLQVLGRGRGESQAVEPKYHGKYVRSLSRTNGRSK